MPDRFSGVLAPVITPFNEDLSPANGLLIRHCKWLLSQDVGLAVFGTNSEANSLGVGEKRQLLDSLVESGIESSRLLPGTGSCALSDAVELTRHAMALNCGGVLMLPPFYYKGVPEEGLYRFYSEVIQQLGNARLRIYLYHIPPVTQVGLSLSLVERLCRDYPQQVVGIKDSSGDWNHTRQLIELDIEDFRVFCGSESFLLRNMQAGGSGCISATVNVNPAAIRRLFDSWQSADANRQQQNLDALRNLLQRFPMIPALKTVTGLCQHEPAWFRVRPPLVSLTPQQQKDLSDGLQRVGFDTSKTGLSQCADL